MSSHISEAVLLYATLYGLASVASVLFLWRVKAPRNVQIGTFVGITLAFLVSVLRETGVLPSFDDFQGRFDGSFSSIVIMFLFSVGVNGIFFYWMRSLRGFILFTIAWTALFASSLVLFVFYTGDPNQGATIAVSKTAFVVGFLLLIGSFIVGFRDLFKWKRGEREL